MAAYAVLLYGVTQSGNAHSADYICKLVGKDWAWFGDHVAMSIDYVVAGLPGRQYETGTGISFRGSPRGTRKIHTGKAEITAYGAGALHIRSADGGEPFKVCATSAGMSAITIMQREF